MIDFENYNAGTDAPDSRDITLEEIGQSAINISGIPRKVHLFKTSILSQGNIGACTVFGSSGALFETAYVDAESNGAPYNQPYDPWTRWDQAKERGASDTKWWTLQGAIQLLKDKKDIVGYARIATAGSASWELLVSILAQKKAIVTGSKRWNWRQVGISPYLYSEKQTNSGHIWAIVGYDLDKRLFICRNSWTASWGDNGHFYLSFDDVWLLYSTYMVLDPSDAWVLKDARNVRAKNYAQYAQDHGIWNGMQPDGIATDEEIYIMVNRAMNTLGLKTRAYYANVFEERILIGKWQMTIWNEKLAMSKPTLQEVAIMFTRAVLRDINAKSGILTRFQVAAICSKCLVK